MLELLIGQIPEAIYFALFMIYAKNLKDKKFLFIALMTIEYVLLLHLMPYSIYPKIAYIVISYVIMKMLYKEKTQLIDIFVLVLSIIILGLTSVPLLFLNNIINNIYIVCIISKIITFLLLFLIYKYRFIEKLSFSQISEKLNGMENVRIVEKLDQIALAIRISCGI